MKRIIICTFLIICSLNVGFAQANKIYISPNSTKTVNTPVNTAPKQIPDSWFTFQPRKIPFVPFANIDYKKMYETPLDVTKYAGAGRVFNVNYKPYYPEKYLYVTDYTFNNFLKYSQTYKIRQKYNGFQDSYEWDLINEYNEWLWNKIRSDFKRTHGMYNATVTDFRGIKHKITWEDGGIVSIYEQRKLYYEYARYRNLKPEEKAYKFLQNFRFPYKDVRVNNPFIEFIQPDDFSFPYLNNSLEIQLHSKRHDRIYNFTYDDKYQDAKPNGGVLEYTDLDKALKSKFIGPDGKIYRYDISCIGRNLTIIEDK